MTERTPVQTEPHFADLLRRRELRLTRRSLTTLQMNLGKLCNQTCRHCHVDAGPHRTEVMARDTFERCLRVIDALGIRTVDLTGGAPELNPNFEWFVAMLRARSVHVMDRCNLTVMLTAGRAHLSEFFAAHQVEVISSLPFYGETLTDRQRGKGVFESSIEALRRLNAVGYGRGTGLRLNLVHNPVGAFLPAPQDELEAHYRRELGARFNVVFDRLYTITNMPISRFLDWLRASGNLEQYMTRLVNVFNAAALENVMCRDLVSVGWDGRLYDCDFNQMLDLPPPGERRVIEDLLAPGLEGEPIATGDHCFGCTAGMGSSCGGETVGGGQSAAGSIQPVRLPT